MKTAGRLDSALLWAGLPAGGDELSGSRRSATRRRFASRRRRDLLVATVVAVGLHVGFFALGELFPEDRPMVEESLALSGEEEGFVALTAGAAPEAREAAASEAVPEQFIAQTSFDSRALVRLELLSSDRGAVARVATGPVRPVLSAGGGFGAALAALGRNGIGTPRIPVFELADLDQPPAIVSQPLPHYPPELARTRATGEVLMSFIVDAEGVVRCPRVVESSRPEFCAPALQAVTWWKFRAGRKDGRRVATRVEVPIAFAFPDARS